MFVPTDNLGWEASLFVAYGIGAIVWLAVAGRTIFRWLRAGRRAARAAAGTVLGPDAALRAGPAIIMGTVELAPGAKHAVRVAIEQQGSETPSDEDGKRHSWKEVRRRVRARPFYLLRHQGEHVRIEVSAKLFRRRRRLLVAELTDCVAIGNDWRVRSAAIAPGQQVIARGILHRALDPEAPCFGYRHSAVGWVLRPPPAGPMLCTEPLEQRFVRWKKLHRLWAAWLLVCFAVVQIVACDYHRRLWLGPTSVATVKSKSHYTTEQPDADGHPHTINHYGVSARTPWGSLHSEDVSRRDYDEVREGSEVPIRHVGRNLVQFGPRATLSGGLAKLLTSLTGVLLLAVLGWRRAVRKARRWYCRRLMDHGRGNLDPRTGLGPVELVNRRWASDDA